MSSRRCANQSWLEGLKVSFASSGFDDAVELPVFMPGVPLLVLLLLLMLDTAVGC